MKRRRVLIGSLALVLAAGLVAFWYFHGDNKTKAAGYARKACQNYTGTSIDVSTASSDDVHRNRVLWDESADNAARAARLDSSWNGLAQATDIQARLWELQDQSTLSAAGVDQGQVEALAQQALAHSVDFECRKAMVQ